MKINIYQVNMERDDDNAAFMNLDNLTQRQPSGVRSEIYDKVFSGDVDCKNLEDVYQMFNLNHPEGYTGRSLSVSDIVEVAGGGDVPPSFYFCDSVGFRKVPFSPDMARDLTQPDTIRVVVVEPGKLARVADIDRSLAGMQGMFRVIFPASIRSMRRSASYAARNANSTICPSTGRFMPKMKLPI